MCGSESVSRNEASSGSGRVSGGILCHSWRQVWQKSALLTDCAQCAGLVRGRSRSRSVQSLRRGLSLINHAAARPTPQAAVSATSQGKPHRQTVTAANIGTLAASPGSLDRVSEKPLQQPSRPSFLIYINFFADPDVGTILDMRVPDTPEPAHEPVGPD